MMRRVLVTHPGRQHSHRAALALAGAGRLAGYWSGVPSLERQRGLVPRSLWRRFVRYEALPLEPEIALAAPWVPALRRLGDRLPAGLAARADFAACRAFDRWAARRLAGVEAGAVLACEISALATFRQARARGWRTLLDAPAMHPAAQERLHGRAAPERVHRRVVAVKEAEIEAADAIVTVSSLARRSYLDAGVPESKVLAVPLGADLALFGSAPSDGREGACRFLFAGAPIRRKGFDLLVAALGAVHARGARFHLRLAGPRGELSALAGGLPDGSWSEAGPRTQRELAAELAAADCLVLPSRSDSFGMVVPEALAAGRPVVVSDQVGAADLVVEGVNGWIVPAGDVDALAARLAACAGSPAELRGRAEACRASARRATWEAYDDRLVAALAPILDGAAR